MKLIEESERGPRSVSAWLPDNRIAFYASNTITYNPSQGGMWLMDADGSGPKELVIEGAFAYWSPDGKQIAFWKIEQDSQMYTESLYVRNIESGEQHVVFTPKEKYADGGALEWSPDGNRILFVLGTSSVSVDDMFKNWDIYILEMGSKKVVKLTNGGSVGSATWSPDGELIAYTYREGRCVNCREALYIMRPDGNCPILLFTPGNRDVEEVSWSPDGHWIAFAWDEGIYLLDTAKVPAIELLKSGATCP